jgi:hypothetical protein
VDDVATAITQNAPELKVSAYGGERESEVNGAEVRGKTADVEEAFGLADEDILVGVIELGEFADDVADVSAYAEVADRPYVDTNPHGRSI